MTEEALTEREQSILEAVIRSYVETAEPAGSRMVARRFGLGISPATVRNTMSDLEEKGYLYHPHTSAGRVPTDLAYRLYVDALMGRPRRSVADQRALRHELAQDGEGAAIEQVVRRAAQALGLLTQELGIGIAPQLDEAALEKLDLLAVSEGKLLLVLSLRAAGVRTVFVNVPARISPGAVSTVARVLNERLAGLPLREIRSTLGSRLRDSLSTGDVEASELLNVFLESADEWFVRPAENELHLGRASLLADQPEFSSGERLRALMELTERRDVLKRLLGERLGSTGLKVTIGVEHENPALSGFTVVTSEYHVGGLRGVIGVIGPTRMPYDRVIALVDGASSLMSEFLT
jgi:heat-inducible transcriptional repressor